jgi:hypothetical protein
MQQDFFEKNYSFSEEICMMKSKDELNRFEEQICKNLTGFYAKMAGSDVTESSRGPVGIRIHNTVQTSTVLL